MSDEGERNKIIQCPTNNVNDVEESEETEDQTFNDNQINQKTDHTHQNTIIFPSTPKKSQDDNTDEPNSQPEEDIDSQNYG